MLIKVRIVEALLRIKNCKSGGYIVGITISNYLGFSISYFFR